MYRRFRRSEVCGGAPVGPQGGSGTVNRTWRRPSPASVIVASGIGGSPVQVTVPP